MIHTYIYTHTYVYIYIYIQHKPSKFSYFSSPTSRLAQLAHHLLSSSPGAPAEFLAGYDAYRASGDDRCSRLRGEFLMDFGSDWNFQF